MRRLIQFPLLMVLGMMVVLGSFAGPLPKSVAPVVIGAPGVAGQQHRLGGDPVGPTMHGPGDARGGARCERRMGVEQAIVGDDAELDLVGGVIADGPQEAHGELLGAADLAGQHERQIREHPHQAATSS